MYSLALWVMLMTLMHHPRALYNMCDLTTNWWENVNLCISWTTIILLKFHHQFRKCSWWKADQGFYRCLEPTQWDESFVHDAELFAISCCWSHVSFRNINNQDIKQTTHILCCIMVLQQSLWKVSFNNALTPRHYKWWKSKWRYMQSQSYYPYVLLLQQFTKLSR